MFIEAVKFVCFLFNAHRWEGILVFAVIGANFALQGLLFLISLPIILSILVSQGHSLQCTTESFMRENVMDELKQMQPEDESKKKMLDILKRLHLEEEMESDGEDGMFCVLCAYAIVLSSFSI